MGDIVELQVEKDFTAGGDEVADDLRSLGGEQLLADFVGGGGVADGLDDALRLAGAGDVQRHDEPIFCKHRLPVYLRMRELLLALELGNLCDVGGLENVQADLVYALHGEHLSCTIGQIDDAAAGDGSAIVDADDDRAIGL